MPLSIFELEILEIAVYSVHAFDVMIEQLVLDFCVADSVQLIQDNLVALFEFAELKTKDFFKESAELDLLDILLSICFVFDGYYSEHFA